MTIEEACHDLREKIGRLAKHAKIAGALLRSHEWEVWVKKNEKEPMFDVEETRELGIMSDKHWNAFVEFIRNQ